MFTKSQLGVMEKLTGLEGRSSGRYVLPQLGHMYDLDSVLYSSSFRFHFNKMNPLKSVFLKELQNY